MDCHFFLQGIFPTQGLNWCLLRLLHRRRVLYQLSHWWKPQKYAIIYLFGHSREILIAACGIEFPDQVSNPGPMLWGYPVQHLSHWATREIPILSSFLILFLGLTPNSLMIGHILWCSLYLQHLTKAWNQVNTANYLLLLIESPQIKLGLNVSEVKVIGQMGNVCGTRGVRGIHRAGGNYRKFTYTHRACYLQETIHRKWK